MSLLVLAESIAFFPRFERKKEMSGTIEKKKKNEWTGTSGSHSAIRDFPKLMRTMQNEFDELFDRLAKKMPSSFIEMQRNSAWGLDMEDQEDCIILRVEAPGFEPSDFDLRVTGDRLVLRAVRKSETKGKEGESQEEHRCYESMILPPGVDTAKIAAQYQKDVLTVTIPKTAEGRGKKIEIKNP
jgi:HSP20 family protein